jgi:hypothetical protein
MRRILLTAAIGALAFSTAGAMAQTVPPVPNASGSQVTNPGTYGNTASPGQPMAAPGQPAVTGTCPPVPNASGSQVTNPCSYGSTANAPMYQGNAPAATGSIGAPPPVPNASGSQVTNPATYGDTKPQ